MNETTTPDSKLFALDAMGSNLVTLGFGALQGSRFLHMASDLASFLRKKLNKEARGLELGAYLLHAIQPANREAFANAAPALAALPHDVEGYLAQNAIGIAKAMNVSPLYAATMVCNAMRSYLSITPDLPPVQPTAPATPPPDDSGEALPELQN